MSSHETTNQAQQQVADTSLLANGMLQRKCACGQHTIAGGECAECHQKNEASLQRAAINHAPVNAVPPIVQETLSSQGQPLDVSTRDAMEPHFGHDFSQVRVHTDAQAAESAQAVNALAYTVGRDVVFGTEQYAPETMEGKELMAHELTHVVQQEMGLQSASAISQPGDQYEQEAEQSALAISQHSPFSISQEAGAAIMRQVARPKAGGPKGDPTEDSNAKELKVKVSRLVSSKFGGDYKKAFDAYDTNHDGSINADELTKLLKDADVGNFATRGAWVSGIMERFDKNKNGKIEWKEFDEGVRG